MGSNAGMKRGEWADALVVRPASRDAQRDSRGVGIQNVRRGLAHVKHSGSANYALANVGANWTKLDPSNLVTDVWLSGERPVECGFRVILAASSAFYMKLSIMLNGVEVTGAANGMGYWNNVSSAGFTCVSIAAADKVKRGRNIAALVYQAGDTSSTVYADAANSVEFWVKEL